MRIFFTHPNVLYALFLIIIPIIVHLFSFRKYKHVYFHNIHLLKTSQHEENRTKTKLKEILILLSRILFISALVIAFAQPFVPAQNHLQSSKKQYVSIYIDNSFSTQAESEEGAVIEQAKKQAQTIVDTYNKGTKFFILENEFAQSDNIALTQEQAIQKISSISISPISQQLSDVCNRAISFPKESEFSLKQYLISDFQKYSSDIVNFPKDSNSSIILLPIKAQLSQNISIDSAWFTSPYRKLKQTETIQIALKNNSNSDYNKQSIKLYLNDSLRAITNFNILAQESKTIELDYTINKAGLVEAYLAIDDYPIVYDNTFYFSYRINTEINCLYIFESKPNPYIQKLLAYDDYINLQETSIANINYSTFKNYDAIIVDGLQDISSGLRTQIVAMSEAGKSIIIIPSANSNTNDYNSLLQSYGPQRIAYKDSALIAVTTADYKNLILENVFESQNKTVSYPTITAHYTLVPRAFNPIITLENSDALLFKTSSKNASLYMFTCPIAHSNSKLATHPLFLSLYNMVLTIANTHSIETTIGNIVQTANVTTPKDNVLHITNKSKQIDIIPQKLFTTNKSQLNLQTYNQIKESGIYELTSRDSVYNKIAFNYNRNESSITNYTIDELKEIISSKNLFNSSVIDTQKNSIRSSIQNQTEGKALWRYFILIAVIFVIIEIALIRFWK